LHFLQSNLRKRLGLGSPIGFCPAKMGIFQLQSMDPSQLAGRFPTTGRPTQACSPVHCTKSSKTHNGGAPGTPKQQRNPP
jgi:hypothetical protein